MDIFATDISAQTSQQWTFWPRTFRSRTFIPRNKIMAILDVQVILTLKDSLSKLCASLDEFNFFLPFKIILIISSQILENI